MARLLNLEEEIETSIAKCFNIAIGCSMDSPVLLARGTEENTDVLTLLRMRDVKAGAEVYRVSIYRTALALRRIADQCLFHDQIHDVFIYA